MKDTIRTLIDICIIMLAVFLIIHRRVFSALLTGAPMPEAPECTRSALAAERNRNDSKTDWQWTMFDPTAKKERHDTVFPQECRKVYKISEAMFKG